MYLLYMRIIITEAYKWKPSKSQKQVFAKKMEDPEDRVAYYKRKEEKFQYNNIYKICHT